MQRNSSWYRISCWWTANSLWGAPWTVSTPGNASRHSSYRLCLHHFHQSQSCACLSFNLLYSLPKLCVRLLPSGPLSRIFIQSIREPLVSSTLVFRDAKTCFKERFASIVVDVNSPIGLLVFGEKAEPLTAACSSHIGQLPKHNRWPSRATKGGPSLDGP